MSEGYQPLFGTDPAKEAYAEGIPDWIRDSVFEWMLVRLSMSGSPSTINWKLIDGFQRRHRLKVADRSDTTYALANHAVDNPEGVGLQLINYVLWHDPEFPSVPQYHPDSLSVILTEGGSAWEVTEATDNPGRYRLTGRDLAGTKQAVESLGEDERASELMEKAWVKIAGRDPDPNGAYDLAIKAVESAAQPVILPKDSKATLGKILAAMREGAGKWDFALGTDVEPVIAMASALWENHWRHGTQARSDHTQDEADAAVHIALALVRFFTGNGIKPAN